MCYHLENLLNSVLHNEPVKRSLCFTMDAIKKFFANFHKHGTISIRRVRKEKIIITKLEKTSPQELKSNLEAETTELEPQQNEGTTTLDEVLEIPMSDLQDVHTAADLKTNGDETFECLTEFDEIMEEINGDILTDQVSLDDIDDVLNIINEEANLKEESLQLEIPRFDLQDLIESFDSSKENLNGDDYMEINELNSLDLSDELLIDLDLFDLENKINVLNSLDKQDKITEESDVFKEKDFNVQSDDVISISSNDSQAADENVKSNKRTDASKNVKNENDEINEPTNVSEETNGEPSNMDSENIQNNEAKNVKNEINEPTHVNEGTNCEPSNIYSENIQNNEAKDMKNENDEINEPTNVNEGANGEPSNMDSEYIQNNEAKNVNDEIERINNDKTHLNNESKINDVYYDNEETRNMNKLDTGMSESKQTTNESYEVNNNGNDGLNDQATKYVTFIDGSDDDCGYHSSDFEFITEDEAKMDGLIVHIKPNILKRKVNKLNRLKTIDNFFQDNNKHSPNGNRPGPSNMQEDGLGIHIFSPGPSSYLQADAFGLYNLGSEPRKQENVSGINNYGPRPSHLHESGTGANIFGHGTSIPVNDPGKNYGSGPTHLHGNGPGANNVGHVPSNMQENGPRPNHLQGNVLSDPSTERWRDYQLRKRLNRRQFVLNYGYRRNHRIIEGVAYHQLFDPSFGPLPNRQFTGLLENKSTLSKNTMLVEYQGLGFDMQMLRECIDNEDENVKNEADESAKKILEMYPGENRKKRRRF